MPFVAFDLYGTLCTFEKIIDTIEETFGQQQEFEMTPRLARQFFTFWYNIALRDYIATSQAGRYCSLLKVLKVTLTRALLCFSDDFEITATDVQIQAIMMSFDAIEPNTEAIQILDMLILEKWDIWVLSVGGSTETEALLNRTQLTKYTSNNTLCCDNLRISKPHPKVYSELMRMAVHKTQRIENFYMVGSYAFDLAGAKNVSFRTVFLNTSEKVYSAQMYDTGGPDITGSSLVECVTKMIDFEKTKHFIQPILTRDAAITIENV